MTRPTDPTGPSPSPVGTAPGAEVLRSEEHLHVTTQVVPYGRAVLRIETTTEQVMVPVTVTRQHARVEYLDVDPGAAGPVDLPLGAPTTGATTAWLTLTADEPVVTTRAVPVERVRLATEWVAASQVVHAQVSREVVDVGTTDELHLANPSG